MHTTTPRTPFSSVFLPVICYLLACGFFASCSTASRPESTPAENAADTSRYIRHARGFQIENDKDYRLLSVYSPFHSDTLRYVLLKQDQSLPATAPPDAQVIRIPVKRIAVTSSMHAGLVEVLEATDALCAVGNARYIYSEKIREKVAGKSVAEISKGESGIDEEKTVALKPDALMDSGNPEAGTGAYKTLTEAGIPVIPNFEWKETTPLGRAEWLKLMAALLDKRDKADLLFRQIETRYMEVSKLVSAETTRPKILVGNNLKDIWYMPGGKSYLARLLHDAGASYKWSDTPETGSLSLAFETVYPWAMTADCWINMYTNGPDQNRQELAAMDSRYTDFRAFKTGALYTFSKRVSKEGANDYWESGGLRPDLVLSDLVKILHPSLLPEHTLYYYQKLN